MSRKVLVLLAVALTSLTLVAAGCGSDSSSSTAAETTTTATETTTTETTTTEESTTESTETTEESTTTTPSNFASAENCKEFSNFGAKISAAFSGTGDQDLQDVADQLDQLAAGAPEEIKADFQTLADGYSQIADAVGNLKVGETPSADDIAKLTQLGSEWGTKMTTASTNIATWAQQNCTG